MPNDPRGSSSNNNFPRLPSAADVRTRKRSSSSSDDDDDVNTDDDSSRTPTSLEFAIRTGRLQSTGACLCTDVPLAKVGVDTYIECARALHALDVGRRVDAATAAAEGTAQSPQLRSPAIDAFVAWGRAFRDHRARSIVEDLLKPKIADLLLFYVSARDYSEDQIASFVEGLSDSLLTCPPAAALKHDHQYGRVFASLLDKYALPAPSGDAGGAKCLSPAAPTLAEAVAGGLVPHPCIAIQHCHALYPTQLSSPMNPISIGERSKQRSNSMRAASSSSSSSSSRRYGDMPSFGTDITRPYFSSLLPFVMSLGRFDTLRYELAVGMRRRGGRGRGGGSSAVCDDDYYCEGLEGDGSAAAAATALLTFPPPLRRDVVGDGDGDGGSPTPTEEEALASLSCEQIAVRRWANLGKASQCLERVWRQVAVLVDCVDPEVRTLAAMRERHSNTNIIDEREKRGTHPCGGDGEARRLSVRVGGTTAVKRPRPIVYKDPLRNVAVVAPSSYSSSLSTSHARKVHCVDDDAEEDNTAMIAVRHSNDGSDGTDCCTAQLKSWRDIDLTAAATTRRRRALSHDGGPPPSPPPPPLSLAALPREVVRHIITHLNPRSLASLVVVSRRMAFCVLPAAPLPAPSLAHHGDQQHQHDSASVSSPIIAIPPPPSHHQQQFHHHHHHTLDDLYILRSLQMARNMQKLLSQFVEQLWAERYVYLKDANVMVAAGNAAAPSSSSSAPIRLTPQQAFEPLLAYLVQTARHQQK